MKRKRSKDKVVPVPVLAVDFVMYHARDPSKLRTWYQKTFGLKKGDEWNRFWSEFDTKPVTFCINGPSKSRDAKWEWSGAPAIAFAVEDIHQAAKSLRQQKVTILKGPIETGVCWMLFVKDPAGNRLVLHQRKNGTSG